MSQFSLGPNESNARVGSLRKWNGEYPPFCLYPVIYSYPPGPRTYPYWIFKDDPA